METIDLSGKTAIVTGGSQGLGRCTATRLYAAGANVGVNYLPDRQGLHRIAAESLVQTLGDRAFALECDVRDAAAIEALARDRVEAVTELEYRLWCIRSPDDGFIRHVNLWNWIKTSVPTQRHAEFAASPLGPGECYWLHREGCAGAAALEAPLQFQLLGDARQGGLQPAQRAPVAGYHQVGGEPVADGGDAAVLDLSAALADGAEQFQRDLRARCRQDGDA